MFSSLFISCTCILLILYLSISCCSKWSGSLGSLLLLHVLLASSDCMKGDRLRFSKWGFFAYLFCLMQHRISHVLLASRVLTVSLLRASISQVASPAAAAVLHELTQ